VTNSIELSGVTLRSDVGLNEEVRHGRWAGEPGASCGRPLGWGGQGERMMNWWRNDADVNGGG
jgi:hypothetical protein